MWLDDIKQWTQVNTYEDIKRLARCRCQRRVCTAACQLLIQKTTVGDDETCPTLCTQKLEHACDLELISVTRLSDICNHVTCLSVTCRCLCGVHCSLVFWMESHHFCHKSWHRFLHFLCHLSAFCYVLGFCSHQWICSGDIWLSTILLCAVFTFSCVVTDFWTKEYKLYSL